MGEDMSRLKMASKDVQVCSLKAVKVSFFGKKCLQNFKLKKLKIGRRVRLVSVGLESF